ncbi:hypothetical protein UUU_03030 (plasmid) [Klebsiella pneumoniae subsp. pneumoniae DSM 30104 = JCM 1662 = NBRC 14940]|nr:hypothetical protein UUU_03030 [Klebsiella pneumoniae subsp. pneumoniae DSM 30104 = JCM 1662 = NBRC 14940]
MSLQKIIISLPAWNIFSQRFNAVFVEYRVMMYMHALLIQT